MDAWAVATIWVIFFIANHWIARSARSANDSQALITVEDQSALRRGFELKYIFAQCLFAGLVFSIALFLGGPAFVLFAGGLIVAMACTLGLNIQGLLSARAMARPNAVKGALTLSTAFSYRQLAYRQAGSALACFLMGLATAHLALLGGALILGSTASGYLRRARHARA